MSSFADAAIGLTALLRQHGRLILELARRDVRDRYAGQALGLAWTIGHPLLLMALYVVLFAYVFPARFGEGALNTHDFSLHVLAGIVPWLTFQEVLGRSSTMLTSNASLVKQIVFPIEALPIKGVLGSLTSQMVATLLLIVIAIATHQAHWTLLLLPIVFVFQLLAMVGCAYFLAVVGAYVRDVKDFVQVFCAVNLFAQPILYNPHRTPAALEHLFYANPFSYMIWCYQDLVFHGRFAHPLAWVVFPIGSVVVCLAGFALFRYLKSGLGDVL